MGNSASAIVAVILPAYILWELWCCRNKFIYDSNAPNAAAVISSVQHQLLLTENSFPLMATRSADRRLVLNGLLSRVSSPRQQRLRAVHWEFPSYPGFKLNVDGLSLGNPGRSGGGIIVRDSQGGLVVAECFHVGFATSFEAELNALLNGLQACVQIVNSDLRIESDNKALVEMLQRRNDWPWRYVYILRQVEGIQISRGWQISHIFREANAVADALARLGSAGTSFNTTFSTGLPPRIRGLLRLDQSYIPYIRRK